MRPVRLGCGALVALLLLISGCSEIGSALVFFGPRRIQKAEYTLTKGRLAVLIETARPEDDNPVFTQALHEKLVEVFRDRKINEQVVPLDEMMRLRQTRPESEKWSFPRLGRALSAEQVLYLRIDRLQARARAGQPIIEPQVNLRVKVYSVDEKLETPRLWPGKTEREGRPVEHKRQTHEVTDAVTTDAEVAKLGHDTAQKVAMPFYDVDQEEKIVWDP